MRKRSILVIVLMAIFVNFLTLFIHAQEMVTTQEGALGTSVSYNVASFTDVRDKTLKDVLNKMPGVFVSDWGLSYNGMRVSKVYINGSDMRTSFMTVADIKPENIENIEFVENFQAIRVLQNKQYSSSAAINIVLKEDAKSKWSGSARLGGGAPLLYDGDLYALQMGAKRQSMINFKVNNTGLNLGRSVSSFAADNIGFRPDYFNLTQYINVRPSSVRLSEERTRLNNSQMFNTVNTLKLSDKYSMYVQVSYVRDKLESENSRNTTFYVSDADIIDEAHQTATSVDNQVKTNIAILANTDDFYFANHVYARGSWTNIEMGLTGTSPNDQQAGIRSYMIQNDLSYLKPFGNWILAVTSRNSLSSNPQELEVVRADSNQHQSVNTKGLYSDTRFSYGLTSNKWTTAFRGGVRVMNRSLNTTLTGVEEMETIDNNSTFGYVSAFIQPNFNYVSDKLQWELGLPVNYYHYWFNEEVGDSTSGKDVVNFAPFLSLKYVISPLLSVTVEGQIDYDEVNAGNSYTGMILTNYKYIRQGGLNYRFDEGKSLETSLAFKLPQYSLFVNGAVRRQWGKSMYSNFDTFIGDYLVSGTIPQESDSRRWIVFGNINKGITSFKGSVGLNISYFNSESSRIRNNETISFISNTWNIAPSVNGRLFKWWNVVYNLSFSHSQVKIPQADISSASDEYSQSLELIFSPTKVLNFSILGEHYHTQITRDQTKNMVLADFKAEYQISNRWQLIASVTNILDQQTYAYTIIDDLTTAHASYKIRPRNYLVSLYYKF